MVEEKKAAAIIFCEIRNLADIPFQKIIVEEKETAIIFCEIIWEIDRNLLKNSSRNIGTTKILFLVEFQGKTIKSPDFLYLLLQKKCACKFFTWNWNSLEL